VLACGAELKSTVCLARDGQAIVSQHLGDLENYETLRSFTEAIEHLGRLFGIVPEVVAHDLHPGYLSTQYAAGLDGVTLLGVQHHHAHIASCLADNGEQGPVIGVAFDGTGYGTDGTLWGGEFLIAGLRTAERAAHLAAVPLPGGEAAIREPWRMAAVYLSRAFPGGIPAGMAVEEKNRRRWDAVLAMAARGINAPATSSAGRLFDAAAALLGVRDCVSYEGQAAIELEQLADPAEAGSYAAGIAASTGPLQVNGADLIRAAAEDLIAGTDPAVIAARLHNGVAEVIVAVCERLRDTSGLSTVALSGGVFQNVLLTERTVAGLTDRGFRVLVHSRVPCNDGGISLGQAAIAAATVA
jgi:hydrogenase maturation protein HypF